MVLAVSAFDIKLFAAYLDPERRNFSFFGGFVFCHDVGADSVKIEVFSVKGFVMRVTDSVTRTDNWNRRWCRF